MMRFQALGGAVNRLRVLAHFPDQQLIFIKQFCRESSCLLRLCQNSPRPSVRVLQIATGITGETHRIIDIKYYIATNFHLQKLITQCTCHHRVGWFAASVGDSFLELVKQPIDSNDVTSTRAHLTSR